MSRSLEIDPCPATPAFAQCVGGHDYALDLVHGADRTLARTWLALGLFALVGSGVFSILLVLSRSPVINQWLPVQSFFRVALVVHVDLSVLVWFVSVAGLLWTVAASRRAAGAGWAALVLCGTGTAIMALAPFIGRGEPVMANYVPVLDGPMFLGGLSLFAVGTGILVLWSLWAGARPGLALSGAAALRFGLSAAAVAAAVALLAFAWSLALVPMDLDGSAYYEILFWGGGHALQFVWTLLMLVAWLWLASATGARIPMSPRLVLAMFGLALVGVFATPYAYLAHDVASVEHRQIHTWAMRFGGGLAILPIGLATVLALWRRTTPLSVAARPLQAALTASIMLFAVGGFIGIFISGSNVKIPAHYHGSIVGVTLALMGLVYLLLPRLGYGTPTGRMARWQPTLYGVGQLMHIVGLVWSGGYGVQRKVAGTEQVLRSTPEIAGMALMGLGGAIAILGGLLFIVVVVKAMRRPVPREPAAS
ncbi:cbb3-type cytochrome c oxidase subunit I [Arenimonas alkanexedens]